MSSAEKLHRDRVEHLLGEIETLGKLNKLGIDESASNSKRAAADARAARETSESNARMLDGLRGDVSRYEGRLSEIEVKLDAAIEILQEMKPLLEGAAEVFTFVRELRAGFGHLWQRLAPQEQRAAPASQTRSNAASGGGE